MNKLYVDLPHTSLEDFAEHFERALQQSSPLLLAIIDRAPLLTLHKEIDDIPPEEAHALANPDLSQFARVLVNRSATGKTQLMYFISIQREDGAYASELALTAIRYRQDKLRLVVTGFMTSAPRRIKSIRQWLVRLWGDGDDGIKPVPPKKAAEQEKFENAQPLILDEKDLRFAIQAIKFQVSTPDWWSQVAALYHRHKPVNPKYTYEKLTNNILGFEDHKYVGEQIRKYSPKTTQNHPS